MSVEFVSFSDPHHKGGIGPTLMHAVKHSLHGNASMVYFLNGQLRRTGYDKPLSNIDPELVSGHYRYAHEFLYPLLIGMPDLVKFSAADCNSYMMLSQQVEQLIYAPKRGVPHIKMVNDYEFPIKASVRIWHEPMPVRVPVSFAQYFTPFIESLLHTESMIFYTPEIRDNFIEYVDTYLGDQYRIDRRSIRTDQVESTIIHRRSQQETRLFAHQLGIDTHYWATLANTNLTNALAESVGQRKIILLIGRCDPAEAWEPALEAVARFLHKYGAEYRGKVVFVVQCGRIHKGLQVYDQLWGKVQQRRLALEKAFGDSVIFIEEHLSHEQLAPLYRATSVALISPWQDAGPLTPKEFVACQSLDNPGVLLLAEGAGVWPRLKNGALKVNPADPTNMSDTVATALQMELAEKQRRMLISKAMVSENTLMNWCESVVAVAGVSMR